MLTPADYASLNARWINSEWADAAGIRRVDTFEGAELVGGDARKRDHSGLWIPYRLPQNLMEARGLVGGEYGGRLRRDKPEMERQKDGSFKEKNKYLTAAGWRNRLYFPPQVVGADLVDVTLTLIITEGEYKTLAARRAATWRRDNGNRALRFLPVGLGGVWGWMGKVGMVPTPDGGHVDEHGVIPDFSFLKFSKRQIIIAFDQDYKVNPQVRAARWQLCKHLMSIDATVGFLEWEFEANGKKANGMDDWLARDGVEAFLEALAKVKFRDGSDWRSKLLCFESTGMPKRLIENARIAMIENDEWRDTLERDVFLGRITCVRRPWNRKNGIWRDEDSIQAACWLQRHGIEVGQDAAYAAAVAAARVTDCAVEWADRLEWDGEPRLDGWLVEYMQVATKRDGADITEYVVEAGTKWLIGAVSRIYEPGSQMDYVLVLCGPEGQGKSTALKILANGWFTDSIKDINHKDALIDLQGVWIVEFSELEAWRRVDWKGLRAFLTCRDDRYRSPYGHNTESHPRRCVFAGTTNEQWFLEGATEGRRFWPVLCTAPAKLEDLKRDAEQLIAEAKVRYFDGARPIITDQKVIGQVREERNHFKQEDAWMSFVVPWLHQRQNGRPLTVAEVLKDCLGSDKAKMGRGEQQRVAAILKTLGYESFLFGRERLRGWRLPDDE